MTSIPDLIANWRKRRLDGDVSFGVLVDETIDLLTRLTTPGDEGLETTEEERADTSWPPVTGFVPRLLRDFDLLRAKLRAAEERADLSDNERDLACEAVEDHRARAARIKGSADDA